MAQQRKNSRRIVTIAAVLAIAGALVAAFWPRAEMVDLGRTERQDMALTIDEEGRTRVRDAYVVSTPVDGRLMRVGVVPGDPVRRGASVVAQMLPINPAALDARTREQAKAAVDAARAGLRVAEADLAAAEADLDLARSDLRRTSELADRGTVSRAALDRARSTAQAALAHKNTAEAAIAQREAQLASAQAQLIGFDDLGLLTALEVERGEEIPIYAPADGRVLQVFEENETILSAGTPILEIGNIEEGLEVVTRLLSRDAVQVSTGDPVLVEDWGGAGALTGTVTRVEPLGVTRVSTLGVEEQRVNVIIRLDTPAEARAGLGHGFRVEVRIVIWNGTDVLTVPSAALIRRGAAWAVFVIEAGRAELREIEVGRDNGLRAEVLGGLDDGAAVVLYPAPGLTGGSKVTERVTEGG